MNGMVNLIDFIGDICNKCQAYNPQRDGRLDWKETKIEEVENNAN